jgi:hypothetical protein
MMKVAITAIVTRRRPIPNIPAMEFARFMMRYLSSMPLSLVSIIVEKNREENGSFTERAVDS